MKLIVKIIFSIVLFGITNTAFTQEFSDQQIGLDVAIVTAKLKKRGLEEQNIQQEISNMRDMYKKFYIDIKKEKSTFSKKAISNQSSRNLNTTNTLVSPQEKAALIALYNATNGSAWTNTVAGQGAWPINDINAEVTSWNGTTGWYGIVVENGHVTRIDLTNNNLNGSLTDLTSLSEVWWINISSNTNLSGNISTIGGLTKLITFYAHGCQLTGNLQSIVNLPVLMNFGASLCNISGIFPQNFNNLSSLNILDLALNELEGDYSILGQIPTLTYLDLGFNRFNQIGSLDYNNRNIPINFSNLINLRYLSLEGHGLKNNINVIGNMINLTDLLLGQNQITGSLPANFSNLNKLTTCRLNHNIINDISSLNNSSLLRILDCHFNSFNNFPNVLSNFTNIISLKFENNSIQGSIPAYFQNFNSLTLLDLKFNYISGEIPNLSLLPLNVFTINNNRFRFIDFINEFSVYKTNLIIFSYSPQAKIDTPITITKSAGQQADFKMCMDDRLHSGDTYQWYKNGILISGATNQNYSILSVTSGDAGVYTCKSYHTTSPDMSPLVLEREPITLNVTNCPEITISIDFVDCLSDPVKMENPCSYTCGDRTIHFYVGYNSTISGGHTTQINIKDSNGVIIDSSQYLGSFQAHTLTILGNYTAEAIITYDNGCTATIVSSVISVVACCTPIEGEIILNGDVPPYTCGDYMKPLRLSTTDTVLTYNWTINDPAGNIVFTSTEPYINFTYTTVGTYTIRLIAGDANGCTTTFNSTFTVVPCCNPLNGDIVNYVSDMSTACTISQWKSIWSNTDTVNNPAVNSWINYRDSYNNIKRFYTGGLENGCQTLPGCPIDTNGVQYCPLYDKTTKIKKDNDRTNTTSSIDNVKLDNSSNKAISPTNCVNQIVHLTFSAAATNVTYVWSVTNPSDTVVATQTNTTGYFDFTPTTVGSFTVTLQVTTANGCQSNFTKSILVEECIQSCTATNPRTPRAKQLFIALLNHLRTKVINNQEIPITGYTCPELNAFALYITDEKQKIYGFTVSGNTMAFWFHPVDQNAGSPDVYLSNWNSTMAPFSDIDVVNYTQSNLETNIDNKILLADGSRIALGHTRHINFCPDDFCVNHIAIVVDESGSIDNSEKAKIKRQLRAFLNQQAYLNDLDPNWNMYVSLIGMADKDINNRTDHVLYEKVTSATIGLFNEWLDGPATPTPANANQGRGYGNRYGLISHPGVSGGSDFWKSGLDIATSIPAPVPPKLVIMITDGSQTNDLPGLKATMAKFNNYQHILPLNETKPHLYVVGIDNGFYVYDEQSALGKVRNEDPNYVPSLRSSSPTSRVTPALALSLKYLLQIPSPDFPINSVNTSNHASSDPDFKMDDFIGMLNMDEFGDPESTFLSDNMDDVYAKCGSTAIKDPCDDCFSFQPEPGKVGGYVLSAWVKEELNVQVKNYTSPKIKLKFFDFDKKPIIPIVPVPSPYLFVETLPAIPGISFKPKGDIIEGWQRIGAKFEIPANTIFMEFELVNESNSIPVFFDDIRIYPVKGNMKSFVYDPETFRLMSELDENNFATYYEYDNEGGLVRIKKETAKGIKTIQETRSGNVIKVE